MYVFICIYFVLFCIGKSQERSLNTYSNFYLCCTLHDIFDISHCIFHLSWLFATKELQNITEKIQYIIPYLLYICHILPRSEKLWGRYCVLPY